MPERPGKQAAGGSDGGYDHGQKVYVSVDYMISNVANRFVNAIFLLP
jgi:hypothetical protein